MKVLRVLVVAVGLIAASAAPAAAGAPWLAPATLGPDGGMLPQVAMNGAGQGIVAWMAPNPSYNGIFVSERQPLGAFGPPARIADGENPRVAIGTGGDAVVTWTTKAGDIEAAVRAPGGMLGAPQVVSAAAAQACANAPNAAVAPDGTAVISWIEADTCYPNTLDYGRRLRVAWRPPGGQFGAPQTVTSFTSGGGYPQLAVDGSDTATLMWASASGRPGGGTVPGDSPDWAIWVATGDATGFQPPIDLSGGVEHLSPGSAPDIALSGNDRGDIAAVWTQPDHYVYGPAVPAGGPGHGLLASIKRPGGAWSGAVVVPGRGTGYAYGPDVTVDARGNAAAAWSDACKIAFAYAPAGAAFGPSVTKSCADPNEGGPPGGDGTAGAADPVVGIDSRGRAVVTYGQSRGDRAVAPMTTIRYTPGTPHELPYGISGPPGSRNIAPSIAFDGLGNGVVVWEGDDGPQPGVSGYDSARAIRIAQYDAEPPVVQYVETPTAAKPVAILGLNEPARIAVGVTRKTTCRRHGKRVGCWRATGSKSADGVIGRNTVRLAHRLMKRAGAYRVQMVATDHVGNARKRTVGFRVR